MKMQGGEKELFTVPLAEHALAEETAPALYWQTVERFADRYIK